MNCRQIFVLGYQPQHLGGKELSLVSISLKQQTNGEWLGISEDQYWDVNNGLRFVDTAYARRPYYLINPTAGGILKERICEVEKEFKIRLYKGRLRSKSGIWVGIMYLPWTRGGGSYIYLFIHSIQKLIQGNNYALIPPGVHNIAKVNAELAPIFEQLGMHRVDFMFWELRRIDISFNFPVGENLPHYLDYLLTRTMAHRSRHAYNNKRNRPSGEDKHNNGVCFYSDLIHAEFYDKELQCKNSMAAKGLRMEISHRKAKAVRRLFQTKNPRLIDLTTNLCQRVLQKDLVVLGLDREIIRAGDLREALLRKGKSACEANTLMGFVDLERKYPGRTPRELSEISKLSEQSIRKSRRKLQAIGVSYMEDVDTVLPALRLDALDYPFPQVDVIEGSGEMIVEDDKKATQVPRNTCSSDEHAYPASWLAINLAIFDEDNHFNALTVPSTIKPLAKEPERIYISEGEDLILYASPIPGIEMVPSSSFAQSENEASHHAENCGAIPWDLVVQLF